MQCTNDLEIIAHTFVYLLLRTKTYNNILWASLCLQSQLLSANHVSFKVPVISSSWPGIEPHTLVHLSLIHPPHPPQSSSSFLSPPPACPIPGCCLTGSKPGLTGGQPVSQAHRREHRLSPLISSFLAPYLNPTTPLHLSPLHPPSCCWEHHS